MARGEVWWVELDERRPVVLLSDNDGSGFQAIQVVEPAGVDISGLGVEVPIGADEGLPFDGVLRFGFPQPGFVLCTWLITVSRNELIERSGTVSPAKFEEISEALRRSEEPGEPNPEILTRFGQIRDALRSISSE